MVRGYLAENLKLLRDHVYRTRGSTESERNRELAKDADCSFSQVQRAAKGTSGVSIDYVEWFAGALGVRPQDLLTPYFAAQALSKLLPAAEPGPSKRPPRARRQAA